MKELKKTIEEIVKHGDASKITERIMKVIKDLPKFNSYSSISDIKNRSISARVALRAAINAWDKIDTTNLKNVQELANDYYVWLRVKQEAGMLKEVTKEINKIEPF